ncbi:hypothetical protein GCM10027565_36450 [Bordetella tumulicola]
MKPISCLLYCTLAFVILPGCTTGEEQVAKDLENLPGVTCTIGAHDQTHCGPDSLKATQTPYP